MLVESGVEGWRRSSPLIGKEGMLRVVELGKLRMGSIPLYPPVCYASQVLLLGEPSLLGVTCDSLFSRLTAHGRWRKQLPDLCLLLHDQLVVGGLTPQEVHTLHSRPDKRGLL